MANTSKKINEELKNCKFDTIGNMQNKIWKYLPGQEQGSHIDEYWWNS
jgi:hypothetical protein